MRNVIYNHRKYFLTGAVFILIFSGCNASTDSICKEFPADSPEIGEMQAQIAALGKPSRRIASVGAPSAALMDQRERWMKWGEKTLKLAQWAKDALEDEKRGRKAVASLNEASLSLVSFHGYLEQLKWKKAADELEKTETSLKRARKIACEAEPAPAPKAAPKARKK